MKYKKAIMMAVLLIFLVGVIDTSYAGPFDWVKEKFGVAKDALQKWKDEGIKKYEKKIKKGEFTKEDVGLILKTKFGKYKLEDTLRAYALTKFAEQGISAKEANKMIDDYIKNLPEDKKELEERQEDREKNKDAIEVEEKKLKEQKEKIEDLKKEIQEKLGEQQTVTSQSPAFYEQATMIASAGNVGDFGEACNKYEQSADAKKEEYQNVPSKYRKIVNSACEKV